MSTPKGYVAPDYLQAAAKLLEPFKRRTYALMQIQPGHKVLDVGCGPGTDTIPLAALVGPTGEVRGVDTDAAMIAEADQCAERAGVGNRAKHERADATALPFESGYFDSCRSERLFQHLPDPEPALSEMIRVTKAGGWVAVLDTDHGTWSTDTPEVDIERRLARFRTEHMHHNGYAGRQLYRLFKQQALADVAAEMIAGHFTDYAFLRQMSVVDRMEQAAVAAGVITADELSRWRASLERAAAADAFFGSECMVLVAGRKS